MNIVRSLKYIVLSAVVSLSLVPGAQAADKLTLIFTTSSATFALPTLIAEQKGWLDAKIITVAGDSNGIRALLAGTGDVTFPGPFSVFSAANEGAKITAIGSWQGVADYNFIVNSDIKSMKDLEGKVFAGTGPSGPPEEYGKLLMRKHGVDISKVRFIAVSGGHSNIVQSVMAGRAGAGMVNSLSALTGVRTGKVKILTNIAKEYPQIGYIYSVVRSDSVNDPKMKAKLQQFVTASIKASRFIMDHPDQAVQILEKHYPDLDKNLVADVIHSLNSDKVWGINGGMSEQQVADNLQIFKENGMLPKNIKPRADVFDYHFIDTALKQLGRK